MLNGPIVSDLIHHMKQCPREILQLSAHSETAVENCEALCNDVLRVVKRDILSPKLFFLGESTPELQKLLQICCWMISSPLLIPFLRDWKKVKLFLEKELEEVSKEVKSEKWIEDEERSEELIRLFLSYNSITPEGETKEEAIDKLASINTMQRVAVIRESAAAIARAKEIREKMAQQKAREAANVYSRE